MIKFESAEAMRDVMKEYEPKRLDDIRLKISKNIRTAAENGKHGYVYPIPDNYDNLPSCIVEELFDAGYMVDQVHHLISWGKN